MALNFPWQMFVEAQAQKNKNREQLNQDIGGLGQGLGQVGQAIGDYKQRQGWKQTIDKMAADPNTPAQLKPMLPMIGQMGGSNPAMGAEMLMSGMKGFRRPEFSAVSGVLSKDGKPIIFDKFTGDTRESDIPATPNTGAQGGMAQTRANQFIMQDLPSRSAPTTAAGAAYQVKVAARQGKALIAKPGSAQALGLSQGDLARAVIRNSPTDEVMKTANFSDNLIARFNVIKQKLTSNPETAMNNPDTRREVYRLFDDMEKASTPWIQNQLMQMGSVWSGRLPEDWDEMKKRELGQNIPDIPFEETSAGPTPVLTAQPQDGQPQPPPQAQQPPPVARNPQMGPPNGVKTKTHQRKTYVKIGNDWYEK